MAFYGFNGDASECYWTPYACNYDHDYDPSHHSSSPHSNPDFNEPLLIEHAPCPEARLGGFWGCDDPSYNYSDDEIRLGSFWGRGNPPYSYSDDLFATTPEVNYSTYRFNQPKLFQYEPAPYVTCHVSYESKYAKISYSTQEFSVPEFEEYDPTPYDGGYDATQVYGKPLPPSDEICYPLSKQLPDGFPSEDFSFASIPSPYGKDEAPSMKPPDEKGKPSSVVTDDLEPRRENGEQLTAEDERGKDDHVLDGGKNGEQLTTKDEKGEDDHVPDDQNSIGNGGFGEYGYECSRQVPYQIPYGYGLEAMDLCECIFGHWPCLAKMNRERCANQEAIQRECNHDPWKSTVDFLFGWPYAYGEQNNGGYGNYVNYYYSHE